MTSSQEKWTEIEHLPGWDEEFYDTYTAKKHGKWVMMKTLKARYRDDPKYRAMLEKEFDVRYNLAHSHIVMINDLEEVPGIGLCIIADDIYGDSLRKLLDEKKITEDTLHKITHQMVEAIEYIQLNHIVHRPLRPESVIFTENIGNLKLIDVGFDQHESLTPAAAAEDIDNYGRILAEVLDHLPGTPEHNRLRRVARRCCNPARRYRDIQALRLALDGRDNTRLLWTTIIFLIIMIGLLLLTVAFPGHFGLS